MEKKEYMDHGYKVVYTGHTIGRYNGKLVPEIHYYDKDGNRFFSNYSKKADAEIAVKKLKRKGKQAIIEPALPFTFHGGYCHIEGYGVFISEERLVNPVNQLDPKAEVDDIEYYSEEYSEEIDDVVVIHRGFSFNHVIPNEDRPTEAVDFYDLNGNKFYANFPDKESALFEIQELNKRGLAAVIGPKAPLRDSIGRPIPNPIKGCVGVYIVVEKQQIKRLKSVH